MKNIPTNILVGIALLSLFAAACTRQEDDPVPVTPEFKPTFEQFAGADEKTSVVWADGDSLKSWYVKESAAFSVVYPKSSLLGTDPTWLTIRIPSQQSQKSLPDIRKYGFWTGSAKDENVTLNPGFAIVRITVDATGTVVESEKATSLSLTTNGSVCGNAIFNAVSGRPEIAASGKNVSLTIEEDAPLSAPSEFHLVCWPCKIDKIKLEVPCTGKKTIAVTLDEEISLEAGKISDLQINLNERILSGSAEIQLTRTNLSEAGTSNCYIVSEPDYYKFTPACGNSGTIPDGLVSVDWLWATEKDLVKDIALDKFSDVTFEGTGGKGNVVLGGFDTSGKIVWTWHLWLTDDPSATLHYGTTTDIRFLDRDLGATSADVNSLSSYGLYYQWGRKDPFIGSNTVGSGTATKRIESAAFTTGTGEYFVNPLHAEDFSFATIKNSQLPAGGEIEYLTSNPMKFVIDDANAHLDGSSWFNVEGGLAANTDLWGAGTSKTTSKTMYDPCPQGWKVPYNYYDLETAGMAGYAVYDDGTGLKGTIFKGAEGTETFFPASGFRDYTGGFVSYAGYIGQRWSALVRTKTNDCWAGKLEGKDPLAGTAAHLAATYGNPVRCVKE